jgi:hypothetical protein
MPEVPAPSRFCIRAQRMLMAYNLALIRQSGRAKPQNRARLEHLIRPKMHARPSVADRAFVGAVRSQMLYPLSYGRAGFRRFHAEPII